MYKNNRFFFKKKLRLLYYKDFQKVFNHAKKIITSTLVVFYMNNKLSYPRLGMIVSKKVSKYAYKRNLIKRFIRESFRISQYYLLYLDFIIIAKANIFRDSQKKLKKNLHNIWLRYYL